MGGKTRLGSKKLLRQKKVLPAPKMPSNSMGPDDTPTEKEAIPPHFKVQPRIEKWQRHGRTARYGERNGTGTCKFLFTIEGVVVLVDQRIPRNRDQK